MVNKFLRIMRKRHWMRHLSFSHSTESLKLITREQILDANEKAYNNWRDQHFACSVGEHDI
jgi:hypothetical protein